MQILNIFHVLVAIAMMALILVQRGAGATAGAAFGSGASGTVFGSRGAGSFLTRATWMLATAFCVISLVMAVVVSHNLAAPETDLGVVTAQPVQDTATADEMPMIEETGTDVPMPYEGPALGDEGVDTGDLPVVDSDAAENGAADADSDGQP